MRIILSRKGYDATSGGVASPVFPNDTFCSLPIPDHGPLLREISFRGQSLGPIVEDLTHTAGVGGCEAHLDPDLVADARPRRAGWRPCFGQVGAAQSHLDRQGVGEGDLFLFFGWFRRVERDGSRWRYLARAPDLRCLFGWLQIGRVYRLDGDAPPSWAADHPHVRYLDQYRSKSANNTLYVAADRLSLPGLQQPIAGGGAFARYAACLQLTEPSQGRSTWRLPACLYPGDRAPLSYHRRADRWSKDDNGVLLRSVARGQEFVLNGDCYPGIVDWLRAIFAVAPVALSLSS